MTQVSDPTVSSLDIDRAVTVIAQQRWSGHLTIEQFSTLMRSVRATRAQLTARVS